jgi:hypothetical protein
MKKRTLPLLLPALAAAIFLSAQSPVPPAPGGQPPVYGATGEHRFNGHYYRLYTGQADLENARKTAARDGGYLVEINSDDENKFLTECFSAYVGKFLIGATRNSNGEWIISSGKPLPHSNWSDTADTTPRGNALLSAVIEFQQTYGKWEPLPPRSKAAGFIVEFNTQPKPRPNVFDRSVFEGIPGVEAAETDDDEKNEPPSDLPSNGISANLLFGRYVYSGGTFRERYINKEITVAGITHVADIREIAANDPVWSKYQGKFFLRLLGDNIICFLNSRPVIEGDNPKVMVKVLGKIVKGPQFQQIILEEARFMSYRQLQRQRRLPPAKPDKEAAQTRGMLVKSDDLLNRGTFELQINPEGATVSCTLDADPDGYGMELYWLKYIMGSDGQLLVGLVGNKLLPEEPESPLINCRIAGWVDPAALPRGGGGHRPTPTPPSITPK